MACLYSVDSFKGVKFKGAGIISVIYKHGEIEKQWQKELIISGHSTEQQHILRSHHRTATYQVTAQNTSISGHSTELQNIRSQHRTPKYQVTAWYNYYFYLLFVVWHWSILQINSCTWMIWTFEFKGQKLLLWMPVRRLLLLPKKVLWQKYLMKDSYANFSNLKIFFFLESALQSQSSGKSEPFWQLFCSRQTESV